MKKRNILLTFGILVFAALFFFVNSAMAKPIELSLSLLIPSKHLRNVNVIQPWVEKVEERTGGKVKITVYYSKALNSFPEAYDAAVNGIADMSEGITRPVRGRFTLTEFLGMPGLEMQSSYNYSRALWYLYNTMPEVKRECAGAKVLWLYASPPARLITRSKPVHTLEDLKGLKIRIVGPTPKETGKAMGFAPVSINSGDLYMALEKGVIDGAIIPLETLVARRLQEVIKYVTTYDLGTTLFFMVMNQDSYDSLPPDVKKAIDELSGEWAMEFGSKAWDKFDNEAIEISKKNGIKYVDLTPEEAERWRERLAPVKDEYAAKLEAKGLPGKKFIEEVEKLKKQYCN